MGNERARMVIGGGLMGAGRGGERYFDQREAERIRKEEQARQDDLLKQEWARADRLREEQQQRQSRMAGLQLAGDPDMRPRDLSRMIRASPELAGEMGLKDLRGSMAEMQREDRSKRREAAGTAEELRSLRPGHITPEQRQSLAPEELQSRRGARQAFEAAGGREAIRKAARTAQEGRQGDKRGAEGSLAARASEAVSALQGAQSSVELQDIVTRVKDTPEAKRPIVRRELRAAQKRIDDLKKAEEENQKRQLARAGRGEGQENKAREITGWVDDYRNSNQVGRNRMRKGVEDNVNRVQKQYAPMATASRNMKAIAERPDILEQQGPGAIAMIYQFLRSMDDSVVREGEIRLFESGLTWPAQIERRLKNLWNGLKAGLSPEEADAGALAELLAAGQVDQISRIADVFAESAQSAYQKQMGLDYERYGILNEGRLPPNIYELGATTTTEGTEVSDDELDAWAGGRQ